MDEDALTVECGRALIEHYADNPHQTFHHEPSVAAVVLDAVPDGWAKVNGRWIRDGNGVLVLDLHGPCAFCGYPGEAHLGGCPPDVEDFDDE